MDDICEKAIMAIETAKERLGDALYGQRPGDGFPSRIPFKERLSLYKSAIYYLDIAINALRDSPGGDEGNINDRA